MEGDHWAKTGRCQLPATRSRRVSIGFSIGHDSMQGCKCAMASTPLGCLWRDVQRSGRGCGSPPVICVIILSGLMPLGRCWVYAFGGDRY